MLQLSKDPIFFRGGYNLYSYAENDPVNKVDISGRCPALAAIVVAKLGAIIVAGVTMELARIAAESSGSAPSESELADAEAMLFGVNGAYIAAVAAITEGIPAALRNPKDVNDFVKGFSNMTNPPRNVAGLAGAAARFAVKKIFPRGF